MSTEPTIQITGPFEFVKDDWDAIAGTNLREQMVRNRVRLALSSRIRDSDAGATHKEIIDWLCENITTSHWYVNGHLRQGPITVYF